MYIKEIVKYYEDEQEADVVVTDGKFDLLCYALQCENKVLDTNFVLSAFGCDNIMTSNNKEYRVQKLEDGFFAYKLQGELVDVAPNGGVVQIGSIIIHDVSCIPQDIKIGDFIEFTVLRIDL